MGVAEWQALRIGDESLNLTRSCVKEVRATCQVARAPLARTGPDDFLGVFDGKRFGTEPLFAMSQPS